MLELSDSLIIFDEIHAYDGHTLGLILVLLEYLQKLGARIFIMTATLPDELKKQLAEAAGIENRNQIARRRLALKAKRAAKLMLREATIEDETVLDSNPRTIGEWKTASRWYAIPLIKRCKCARN